MVCVTLVHIRASRLVMMSLVLKVQRILHLRGYQDNDNPSVVFALH